MAHSSSGPTQAHGTTVLAVRRGAHVVLVADGQVTLGQMVVKHGAHKLRQMQSGKIIAGFAGATADAFTLFERFESKLQACSGNLTRAAVALTQDWRTDRMLRRLEAMLLLADAERTLLLSGTGDVLEPDHGVMAIGSGGSMVQAAAQALLLHTELAPRAIATAAMNIAAQMCIYTNDQFTYLEIGPSRPLEAHDR